MPTTRKHVRNVRKDSSANDTESPEAPAGLAGAVPPACAVNCAVIVTAHDASGDTGQNCDRGIFTGNREFRPVSSELDGIRFGLANRRLQPLGHLSLPETRFLLQSLRLPSTMSSLLSDGCPCVSSDDA